MTCQPTNSYANALSRASRTPCSLLTVWFLFRYENPFGTLGRSRTRNDMVITHIVIPFHHEGLLLILIVLLVQVQLDELSLTTADFLHPTDEFVPSGVPQSG